VLENEQTAAADDGDSRFLEILKNWSQGIAIRQGEAFVFVNQAFADLCGYDSPEAVMALGSAYLLVDESERVRVRQYYAARVGGGTAPTSYELRFLRKDGSPWWSETRAQTIVWNGAPAVMMAISDISERKYSEDALNESERRFRYLVEGSIQGLIVHVSGKPKFANQAFADILGYDSPADVLLINSVDDLIHADDIGRVRASREARFRGEAAPEMLEHKAFRKDGSMVWVEVRPTVVEWEGEQATHSAVVDISERKRAEETLLDREARFKDYAEMAADWIWETDAEHRIVFMSDRYYDLTGYSASDVIGKSRREAPAFRHDDKAVRDLIALLDRKEPYRDYQTQLKKADGGVIHSLSSGRPLFDKDGAFLGFRGISTDFTARKRAEDALRQAHDELEAKVQMRTQELRKEVAERQLAQQEAIQASQAKSEFLSSMSHELRTPLNAILGFAQLLRDFSDAPLSEEQASNLQQILSASKHLLGLINDILDLSRIEEGRLNLSFESIALGDCVRDCLLLVRPLAVERDISIIDECGGPPELHLKADPTRLKQILLNVISNAVKYNHDAGTVSVSAETIENGMIRIGVADTGPGIPAEKHGEVFRPFSRLGAEASKVEGTGIGLTISRQLIESMAGRLDFESTPGEGSTFWIDVPMAVD